ncbi:MAG: hypothetical protein HYS05_13545 [Acidobacteria bacterium]|nr:hypothetical protein [Acidobacteriota bacterium]
MAESSANRQLAVSSLVAALFSLGLGVAVGLARQHPMPGMIVTVNGTIMTVGLFALPLVWWGHKVGYTCAIAVGLVNVVGDVFAIGTGLPFSEGMPEGTIAIAVSQIAASALVVLYCLRAWRE